MRKTRFRCDAETSTPGGPHTGGQAARYAECGWRACENNQRFLRSVVDGEGDGVAVGLASRAARSFKNGSSVYLGTR
jgi:hypothetical protein